MSDKLTDDERDQRAWRLRQQFLGRCKVGVLEQAALIADQVEATARPGDGKDAAAEIGRRIRALMEEER